MSPRSQRPSWKTSSGWKIDTGGWVQAKKDDENPRCDVGRSALCGAGFSRRRVSVRKRTAGFSRRRVSVRKPTAGQSRRHVESGEERFPRRCREEEQIVSQEEHDEGHHELRREEVE